MRYVNGLDKARSSQHLALIYSSRNMGSLKKESTSTKPNLQKISSFVPEDNVRRCGYFWLATDWIFRLFRSKDPYERACALHDELFEDSQGLTRKQVDRAFYDAMQAIWERHDKPKLMWLQMQIYYGIVRSLGGLFWNKRQ